MSTAKYRRDDRPPGVSPRPQISPVPEFPAEAIPAILVLAERAIEEVNKGSAAQPESDA